MTVIMESSTQNKTQIYDRIRKTWVAATPEERVRQLLIHKMIDELFYPEELIVVEKALSEVPSLSQHRFPLRRLDILCFAKGAPPRPSLYPLLVIECKETEKDSKKALEQVKGYNHFLRACFFAVAYPGGELFAFPQGRGIGFLDYLPSYTKLVEAVS